MGNSFRAHDKSGIASDPGKFPALRQPQKGMELREGLITATYIVGFTAYVLHRLYWLQSQHPSYPEFGLDLIATILAAAALLYLMAFPRARPVGTLGVVIVGALLGLLFFVSTLGFALADPGNIEWLMRGDWAQHFVGWHLYRSASWQWPPGAFDNFWHPVGTAIVFTDSLPLAALPLKLISAWLPERFQYIGTWLLVNCVLQGVFAILLLRCFIKKTVSLAIGTGLILLAPVFISRIDHDTLTTHWLLLAGLWMYFRPTSTPRRACATWLVLVAVSALVHPYLNVMLLALAAAYYSREVFAVQRLSLRSGAVDLGALVGVSLFCWWLIGALTLRPSSGGVSLGVYNANLLAWFDPQWMSRWFKPLPSFGDGQYEGKGYLGIGVWLLALLSIGWAVRARYHQKGRLITVDTPWWPLAIVVALLTLYAFSTRFALGSWLLVDITPPHLPLIDTFRSSGRFIWASCYLFSLLAIVPVAQRTNLLAPICLGVAFFVQLVELAPLHIGIAQMREGIYQRAAEPTLSDPFWATATQGKKNIVLVPPPACGKEAAPYFPFSLLAGDRHLTINTGYLARFDEKRTFAYCDQFSKDIATGIRDADTLYVVGAEQLDAFRANSRTALDCRIVDGYNACVTLPNP